MLRSPPHNKRRTLSILGLTSLKLLVIPMEYGKRSVPFSLVVLVDGESSHGTVASGVCLLCEAPAVSNGCSTWHALGTAKTVTRVP